jgi:CBS domain containing-hemolysin-like protein
MRLTEWEEATGVPLESTVHEAVETIGGAVMMRLGRIPQIGDEVTFGDRTVRVEALDGMRVARVRLLPDAPAAPASADSKEDIQPDE